MRPHRDSARPDPLAYPSTAHVRRHGPMGYAEDEKYKPFLRDEFDYRCVYCLCREAWSPEGASHFSVEHLIVAGTAAPGLTRYETLVYASIFGHPSGRLRGSA